MKPKNLVDKKNNSNSRSSRIQPDGIGIDWGTTNLRAFAMSRSGKMLAKLNSDRGMATLHPSEFEPVLLDLIADWLVDNYQMPVYACGMIGARQGWIEAPYRSVPCVPVCDQSLTTVSTKDRRVRVKILPGISQRNPDDVMRGEETQLAGFTLHQPSFIGSVCLPGTHSKWAWVNTGVVTSFRTFMTGELFSLLCKQSVLRHSVTSQQWDMPVFIESAINTVENPTRVSTALFGIRAGSLLRNTNAAFARSTLSGLLVGQELHSTREFWQSKPVAVIGNHDLATLYVDILSALGAKVQMIDATEATLAGLTRASIAIGSNK